MAFISMIVYDCKHVSNLNCIKSECQKAAQDMRLQPKRKPQKDEIDGFSASTPQHVTCPSPEQIPLTTMLCMIKREGRGEGERCGWISHMLHGPRL